MSSGAVYRLLKASQRHTLAEQEFFESLYARDDAQREYDQAVKDRKTPLDNPQVLH